MKKKLEIRDRKSKMLAIRLTDGENRKVEHYAKKFKVSKMEIGRALLNLGIKAYEEDGVR